MTSFQKFQRVQSKAATCTMQIESLNSSLEIFTKDPMDYEDSDTEGLLHNLQESKEKTHMMQMDYEKSDTEGLIGDLQSDETSFKRKDCDQNSNLKICKQEAYTMAIRKIGDLEKENETLLHELIKQNNLAEMTKLRNEQQIARKTSELEEIKKKYEVLVKNFEMLSIDYEKETSLEGFKLIFETSLEGFKFIFETSLEGFRKQLGV